MDMLRQENKSLRSKLRAATTNRALNYKENKSGSQSPY